MGDSAEKTFANRDNTSIALAFPPTSHWGIDPSRIISEPVDNQPHQMPNRTHPVLLVVEDNREEAEAIRQAFEQLGYTERIRILERGLEAIDYLDGLGQYGHRAKYPLPDFVLIDLDVADANAFEILEWLQNKPHLGGIRTVVMTTGENVASMNRAYQLGAASFITKPLNFSEFRDTIQSLYTQWSAARKSGALANGADPD